MHVQVEESDWLRVVGQESTEFLPVDLFREPVAVGTSWSKGDAGFERALGIVRDYVNMFPEFVIRVEVVHGFGGRLIGGEYNSDWEVYDTHAQAQAAFGEFFE